MALLRAALRTIGHFSNAGESALMTTSARQAAVTPLVNHTRNLRTRLTATASLPHSQPRSVSQEVMVDDTQARQEYSYDVMEEVNRQVRENQTGRLFAAVFLQGKQHLVTPGDLVVVQTHFPPNIGDGLRLEKVMLVGGRDFTLFGRPLLGPDLVRVEATVVEKTLSHCRIHFYNIRRKNTRRTNFIRVPHTLLRINCIEITHEINKEPEVTGVDGRVL